jgi:hypothetical protein
MTDIAYHATKTSREFHANNAFCRINKGPVRSGKSVRCLLEIVRRAVEQAPAKDGIRYSKWLIGRKSYPQLKSTTIKTWSHWFPEQHFGKIKWDSPITHHLKFNDVDCEVLFMPFESEHDVDKLKSLELTGGYLNELQYLPESILTTMLERCNSYPPKTMGAPITFSAVWADTNPPSTRHWIYELENKRLPTNFKYFHDIPAVIKVDAIPKAGLFAVSRDGTIYINNPAADYIENLPTPNYYLNQIPALSDEEVKVTCMGQYGFTRAGKPVYPDYNDVIHFRNESIKYNRNETLYMGWDFGLTPAVALFQWQEDGRLAQIGEITSQDFGVEKFAENIVIPWLKDRCPGWQNRYVSVGDPAGVKGNEQTASPGAKNSSFDALCRLGIITRPARSNALDARIGAVSWFLRKIYNGRGALIVSKDCQQSREGFLGDYQYEKITIGGIEESSKPQPLKNFSSHIHDAIQYILMHIRDSIAAPSDDDFTLTGSKIY